MGGLRGWGLYVDGTMPEDKFRDDAIRVCLHQHEKTKFTLCKYSNDEYSIKVANGRFVGWALCQLAHPKHKNIFNLVIMPK